MNHKLIIRAIIITLLFPCVTKAEEWSINFAPLPIKTESEITKDFLPLFLKLKEKIGVKTNFVYEKDYSKIIEKFKNGTIDIALLGPLPYLKLKQKYPNALPLVGLNQEDGKPHYRCVLAKFGNDDVKFQNGIRVALTQPLSTCGYFMTQKLLKEGYQLELGEQKFDYVMSHENALLGVLEGSFDIAGVKDDVAHEYRTLGMEVIAQSSYLPGFALIANTKTLSKGQIALLQKTLTSIPKSEYSSWSKLISYGFTAIDEGIYGVLDVDFDTIISGGNMK
jgi:phosphonate transport system substrate-binding protein